MIDRRLCELLGICWHERTGNCLCSCRKQFISNHTVAAHIKKLNPHLSTDPVALLRVMREREDWAEFKDSYVASRDILLDYIFNPALLAQAAVEWLEGSKGKVTREPLIDPFW